MNVPSNGMVSCGMGNVVEVFAFEDVGQKRHKCEPIGVIICSPCDTKFKILTEHPTKKDQYKAAQYVGTFEEAVKKVRGL